MNKVNTYCGGASVRHKTTIAVQMDLVFDSAKMESELNGRFVDNQHVEIRPDLNSWKVIHVTFPSARLDTETAILEMLGKIEDEVKAAVEADRLQGLVITERVVVR